MRDYTQLMPSMVSITDTMGLLHRLQGTRRDTMLGVGVTRDE